MLEPPLLDGVAIPLLECIAPDRLFVAGIPPLEWTVPPVLMFITVPPFEQEFVMGELPPIDIHTGACLTLDP